MKKTIILVAASVFTFSAFASDDENNNHPVAVAKSAKNISKYAVNSFLKDFKEAKAVSWEMQSEIYFAYFMLEKEQLVAAYDDDGNHISTGRYIEFSDLPLAASLAIKEKFPAYKQSGRVAEIAYYGYTVYHFTLTSDKQSLRIKATADGDLNIVGRQKNLKKN